MQYTEALNSDFRLPVVGLGTMGFGGYFKGDKSNWSKSISLLDAAHEYGIKVIDTAELYGEGNAEKIIGSIDSHKKNDLFIMSKFSPHRCSKKDILKALDATLVRLGRDWVDVYQPHWPNPKIKIDETLECLTELRNAGKIRFIGVSNFNSSSLPSKPTDFYEIPRFFQCEFNPLEQIGYKNLTEQIKISDGVIIGYSPFREGQIFQHENHCKLIDHAEEIGVTAGQLVLAWIIKHDNIITIPKCSSIKRLAENFSAMDIHLGDKSFEYISSLFKVQVSNILPSDIIPFDAKNSDDRLVYRTLDDAIQNQYLLSPSPKEIAEEIEQNNGNLNKPIKVRVNQNGTLTLIEGRLRYWGWLILYGPNKPIPTIVTQGAK